MVDVLGPHSTRPRWDLLKQVFDGTLSLARLYDAYASDDREEALDALARAPHGAAPQTAPDPLDTDVAPLVAVWHATLRDKVRPDTAEHYVHYVRTLIPIGKPFLARQLTTGGVQTWIDTLTLSTPRRRKSNARQPVTPRKFRVPRPVKPARVYVREGQPASRSTKRKAAAALSRFLKWLRKHHPGVLPTNPMHDVELPAAAPPRVHYLDTPDAVRLVSEMPEPLRAFSALLAGTGIEVSVALQLRVRDVSHEHREAFAAGTKTWTRQRTVRVAEWAWPFVEAALAGKSATDLIFPDALNRHMVWSAHVAAVGRLVAKGHEQYSGYTARDHRHTYAVRAVRAGVPAEIVAQQLGHKDTTMINKVYGRFRPRQAERDHWERVAAAFDAEGAGVIGRSTTEPR